MASARIPDSAGKDTDILSRFTQKAQEIVFKYFKYILVILLFALTVFGGSLLWRYWENHKNWQAEEELYLARFALIAAEKKAKGEVLSSSNSNSLFDTAKKAPEYTQEIEQKAQNYLTHIQHYLHLPAGALSAIEMAHFLRSYDRNKQALELLEKTNKAFKQKSTLGILLAFQLSLYWMNEEKYQIALEKLQWVKQQEKALWLKPDILLRIGLIYEKLNQPVKAKAIYTQIKKDFTKSQAAARAKQYLNLLEIKKSFSKAREKL